MAASTSYQNHSRDVQDRSSSPGAQISEKAAELASKASDKMEGAVQSAERAAQSIAEQGRDAGEKVSEVAGNLKTAVDKSVRDQPMATLIVAAGLGFVIGALWKS